MIAAGVTDRHHERIVVVADPLRVDHDGITAPTLATTAIQHHARRTSYPRRGRSALSVPRLDTSSRRSASPHRPGGRLLGSNCVAALRARPNGGDDGGTESLGREAGWR